MRLVSTDFHYLKTKPKRINLVIIWVWFGLVWFSLPKSKAKPNKTEGLYKPTAEAIRPSQQKFLNAITSGNSK